MRRLPVIAVTVVLAILLVAALATAVVTASSPAASAAPEPAPAAPAAPAAPGGPAAPGASGSPGAQAAPGAPGSPAAPGAPAAAPTSVAFLGDGYTAATPEGGRGPANYTALIAQRDGWRTVTNDSVFGSGYVADPALGTRVQKILAGGPQLVVVTAGRADDASSPAEVGTAATALYQDLKTRLPQAKVIVIGPMWLGPDVPQRMTAVRDAIRDAATEAQLPFVDPIAAGWFADGKDVGPSGLVPNDAGHTRLAQLVDDALKQSGAVPR